MRADSAPLTVCTLRTRGAIFTAIAAAQRTQFARSLKVNAVTVWRSKHQSPVEPIKPSPTTHEGLEACAGACCPSLAQSSARARSVVIPLERSLLLDPTRGHCTRSCLSVCLWVTWMFHVLCADM